MANSSFEPKKIVRYADSNIPKNGISSIPTPTIKPSPATAKAAVEATAEAPAPPAPAPVVPPAPIEVFDYNRSFSFDGATDLTGSYSHQGGRSLYMGTFHTTIAPGWGREETGTFTILSIKDKNNPNNYTRTFAIERESGSNGYRDLLVCSISSGSVYYTYKGELDLSPNFYSGSGGTNSEQFIETYFIKGALYGHRVNGHAKSFKSNDIDYNGSVQTLSNLALQSNVHSVSIGGSQSTPANYFKGTMANLSIAKLRNYYFRAGKMGDKAENSEHIDILYRFENNLSASKGDQDLEVRGTETYVSSSL